MLLILKVTKIPIFRRTSAHPSGEPDALPGVCLFMDPFDRYLNDLVSENSREFDKYSIRWINPYTASDYEGQRTQLIDRLDHQLQWSFQGTKPWVNSLSPGCVLCGQGKWSCLFITGVCNAACFYCPAAQTEDHQPATQSFDFDDPVEYASYLNRFGFTGCSFSGGEPLLVYDRLKSYLTEIRKSCSPDLYIWMYTNGILGSRDRFKELTELGLDEVRFDIGATGFNLKNLEKASGVVRNLTVEIPAVPHEEEKLIKILPQLEQLGVTNLNLHSLRLTHHNARHLTRHDYTYLHGEQVVVMESELLAFKLMNQVAELQLNLGVNYCSSQYKRKFQRSGFRRRVAALMHPAEYCSEMGYIIRLDEAAAKVSVLGYEFEDQGPNKQVPVLTKACQDLSFDPEEISAIKLLMQEKPLEIPTDPLLFRLWKYLWIEEGMRPYF